MRRKHIIDIVTLKPEQYSTEREIAGSYGGGESKTISVLVKINGDWTGKVTFIVTAFGEEKHRGDSLLKAIEVYNGIKGRIAL